MKRTLLSLTAAITTTGAASAAITFRSDFDEASLGAITGLNIDTPNTTGANSGTVTLDTGSQRLDLTANAADLWGSRDGAPIAWVSSPTVAIGESWYVETQIIHTDSPNTGAAGFDQAGITFYNGAPGGSPGSDNTGAHQSLIVGINDWAAWAHRIQGFADNNPNVSVAATTTDDNFLYRVEITEGGALDLYNFFYKEDPADAWTQYGPANLAQDFDNSAVGMLIKSNNNNSTASTEFEYFEVGTIDAVPEPGTGLLTGLAALSLAFRRRRK